MKMTRFPALFLTTLVLTALSDAGCAEKDKPADATATAAVPPPASAAVDPAVRWRDLKGCTFDQRDLLLGGLKPLVARVDAQISELKARRTVMVKQNVDTADWDFAMKSLEDARSYLNAQAGETGKASRENWDQQKDRLDRAWVQTQDAYGKVKASTTN